MEDREIEGSETKHMSKTETTVKELNKLVELATKSRKKAASKWLEMRNEEGIGEASRTEYEHYAKYELLQKNRDWRLIIAIVGASSALTLVIVYLGLLISYLMNLLIMHGVPF